MALHRSYLKSTDGITNYKYQYLQKRKWIGLDTTGTVVKNLGPDKRGWIGYVKARISGTNIQLVLFVLLPSGTWNELASINIGTFTSGQESTIRICIMPFTKYQFFVEYWSKSTAGYDTAHSLRLIVIKYTSNEGVVLDTIAQSSAITISSAATATSDSRCFLIPMGNDSWMMCKEDWASSGDKYVCYQRMLYTNFQTNALTANGSSWTTVSSSNANTRMIPKLANTTGREFPSMTLGYFYKNTSGVLSYYFYISGRSTTITGTAADLFAPFSSVFTNSYISNILSIIIFDKLSNGCYLIGSISNPSGGMIPDKECHIHMVTIDFANKVVCELKELSIDGVLPANNTDFTTNVINNLIFRKVGNNLYSLKARQDDNPLRTILDDYYYVLDLANRNFIPVIPKQKTNLQTDVDFSYTDARDYMPLGSAEFNICTYLTEGQDVAFATKNVFS